MKNFLSAVTGCLYCLLITWFYCGTSSLIEFILLVSRKAFNILGKIDCVLKCECVGFTHFHPPVSSNYLVVLGKVFFSS